MPRNPLKLIRDIRGSVESIREYTTGMSEADYLANRTIRRAVEREFEIIGEAMKRLATEDPMLAERITESSRVIAFRNVLAHGYDVVEDEIVWSIVRKWLPTLLAEVEELEAELRAHRH